MLAVGCAVKVGKLRHDIGITNGVPKTSVVGQRLCRNSSVLLEVIQCSKRENQGGNWNCQRSCRASQRLPPIRSGEKNYDHRYQRHN
jgi:hypothetical protein